MRSEDFVVPRFVDAALRGAPITIYGDGSQTRTFCFIDDNLGAVLGFIEGAYYINDVLDIDLNVEMRIIDMAELMIEIVTSMSVIQYLPPLEEGDMARRRPGIANMKAVLNRSLIDIREGLRRLIDHKQGARSA